MNIEFLGAALESPAKMLLLLVVANGVPVLGKKIFGATLGRPFDGGMQLRDGHPLFGPSKTVRGVVFAFILLELLLSRVLFRLRLRDRPY